MVLKGKLEKESPTSDGHKAVIFFSPDKVWKGITRSISAEYFALASTDALHSVF